MPASEKVQAGKGGGRYGKILREAHDLFSAPPSKMKTHKADGTPGPAWARRPPLTNSVAAGVHHHQQLQE